MSIKLELFARAAKGDCPICNKEIKGTDEIQEEILDGVPLIVCAKHPVA